MSEKFSRWISGKKKPELVGVYLRAAHPGIATVDSFSFWDGSSWGFASHTVDGAANASRQFGPSGAQKVKWRGLAENPEA